MGSTKFYLILTIHQLGPNFDNAHSSFDHKKIQS